MKTRPWIMVRSRIAVRLLCSIFFQPLQGSSTSKIAGVVSLNLVAYWCFFLGGSPRCLICLDDSAPELYKNSCGHVACRSCWRDFFSARIFGGSIRLVCVEGKCGQLADVHLAGVVSPWEVINAWQNRNLDAIISPPEKIWCPSPHCQTVFCVDVPATEAKKFGTLLQVTRNDASFCLSGCS